MVTFDASRLEPRPIEPNPGGQLDPGDHIGHGKEYNKISTALRGQGALLTGDRRMGKTSMLNVVEAELRAAGHEVVRLSAETEHFATFATRLRDQVRRDTSFGRELDNWSLEVDVERAGIALKRKARNRREKRADQNPDDFWAWAIARVSPKRLHIVLDEITVLAHNLHVTQPGGGLELLSSLKRARDMTDGAVMIFSGSIGIHHALPDSTAINDLLTVAIGPLEPDDATYLARCLMLGAKVAPHDDEQAALVARAIVEQTGGIAYYIHHLAAAAQLREQPLTPQLVVDLVTAAIEDPDDPWNFNHYEERLSKYYGDRASVVSTILDDLATATSPLGVDDTHRLVAGRQEFGGLSIPEVRRLLTLLERDHYLRRDGTTSRFASELLRRAWIWIRRL